MTITKPRNGTKRDIKSKHQTNSSPKFWNQLVLGPLKKIERDFAESTRIGLDLMQVNSKKCVTLWQYYLLLAQFTRFCALLELKDTVIGFKASIDSKQNIPIFHSATRDDKGNWATHPTRALTYAHSHMSTCVVVVQREVYESRRCWGLSVPWLHGFVYLSRSGPLRELQRIMLWYIKSARKRMDMSSTTGAIRIVTISPSTLTMNCR